MKLYLTVAKENVKAIAEYDEKTKEFKVLKGSTVCKDISHSATFSGNSIKKVRDRSVENNTVIKDVTFKSASTAANFVTGTSTNGLMVWKDKEGKRLKQILLDKNKRA